MNSANRVQIQDNFLYFTRHFYPWEKYEFNYSPSKLLVDSRVDSDF